MLLKWNSEQYSAGFSISIIISGIFKLSGNLYCLAHHPIGLPVSKVKLFKFRSLKVKIIALFLLFTYTYPTNYSYKKKYSGFFFSTYAQKSAHLSVGPWSQCAVFHVSLCAQMCCSRCTRSVSVDPMFTTGNTAKSGTLWSLSRWCWGTRLQGGWWRSDQQSGIWKWVGGLWNTKGTLSCSVRRRNLPPGASSHTCAW